MFLFTGKCETKAGNVILQNVTEIKTHCAAILHCFLICFLGSIIEHHFFSFPNLCPATPTKTKGSAQVLELGTAVTACIRREVVVRWSWDFKECGGISPLLAYAMFTDDSDMISLGKLVVWSVYKGFSLLFCFLSIDAKCG